MTERTVVEEETAIAGIKRQRVLSLVDKLHRDGAITFDQFSAAGILRNAIMMEIAPSEGVSSYGANVTAAEPSAKGDRAGRRLTGFEISPDGRVSSPGGRKTYRNERGLEDAIFAAVGVHDDDGARRINRKHADILIRVVTHTESMPTLTGITLELTDYYGAKSKQTPPFALGVVSTWLGRLALHYKLAK
jgi:hypothetical protein